MNREKHDDRDEPTWQLGEWYPYARGLLESDSGISPFVDCSAWALTAALCFVSARPTPERAMIGSSLRNGLESFYSRLSGSSDSLVQQALSAFTKSSTFLPLFHQHRFLASSWAGLIYRFGDTDLEALLVRVSLDTDTLN